MREAVKDVGATIPEEMLRDAAQNVRKRSKACIEAFGGHFDSWEDLKVLTLRPYEKHGS